MRIAACAFVGKREALNLANGPGTCLTRPPTSGTLQACTLMVTVRGGLPRACASHRITPVCAGSCGVIRGAFPLMNEKET
ncbi:MAG: hypothetical protein Kow0077_28410 [Anaerolineae bacterium]